MVTRMTYTPSFATDEFWKPSPHYGITIGGKRILYAYIRKNACTAFKRLINRRLHPKYAVKMALGQEKHDRYHIQGNMKYFALPRKGDIDPTRYDEIIFVYRDPVDRFVSVFTNKFVDDDNNVDIRTNFEGLTGIDLEDATFRDFMLYAQNDFCSLDCHLAPQKSHLRNIPYSRPIALGQLSSTMTELIGAGAANEWFGRKVNASTTSGSIGTEKALDLPVSELRNRQRQGTALHKSNFITDELEDFIHIKYEQDYKMIEEVHDLPAQAAFSIHKL
jgi:hypothetical protein